MTTKYRMLEKGELVIEGDEFQRYETGPWHESANWRVAKGKQETDPGYKYRRPVTRSQAIPQWRHPDAPGCPVHVLWAESPSTVRTVAQVAAEAKPEALEPKIEPGTGYRLLGDDEIVEFGDQWHNPGSSQGDWCRVTGSVGHVAGTMAYTYRRKLPAPLCPIDPPAGYYILGPDVVWQEGDLISAWPGSWTSLARCNFGTTTNTWTRCKGPRWCCRKLPVPESQYKPYANAAEAAAGLQGKLITHERSTAYYPVTRVRSDGVEVAEDDISFSGLKKCWKFTDGTPCGVLITDQGKQ